MFHQVAGQMAREQRRLLLDEGAGGGVGQVLDGLAPQDRQLAATRIEGAELPIGIGQIIAHQVQQQRFDLGVLEQLHLQAVFQIDQGIADVVGRLHQVHQGVPRPAMLVHLGHAQLVGDLHE